MAEKEDNKLMKKIQQNKGPKIEEKKIENEDDFDDIDYQRPLLPEIKIDEKDQKNLQLTKLINLINMILENFYKQRENDDKINNACQLVTNQNLKHEGGLKMILCH